jgi:tryptophanyl-tRNA synthetase
MDRVVFSGIQPSGELHIGNYLGAVRNWVRSQKDGTNIFCVVDMHAITVEQNPHTLNENALDTAALLIASGIDSEKSVLFIQSQNPDHGNLAWILNCYISMGQMSRMTQFKEKSEGKGSVSVGLFDYPALMAADILLYDTTHVPVGDDQKQHVELARDVAEKFNNKFGETFQVPEPVISEHGARVMSLQDPLKKMSKSDLAENSRIGLLDSDEEIEKKIMSSVTDSENRVIYGDGKSGIANLIEIYSQFLGKDIGQIESKFEGKGYGEFKKAVAEVVVENVANIRIKQKEIRESGELEKILHKGAERARDISGKKLKEVYQKIGFVV